MIYVAPASRAAYISAMPITPDEPLNAAERAGLFRRIIVVVFELNVMLRALAMGGHPIGVDTVERMDPLTGGEYGEVVVSGHLPEDEDAP